ncbi:MAG: hypothetical protein A2033_15495 [Bacteroidetes bacterium GWA2_31_9]|nr:MAG: hypothetical protein A2033_15495 [Bacteroidetes bacterium GWA2_31_9]
MFKGKRIYIRKLEESDVKKKTEWVNNEIVNETLMFDFPLSLSESLEWYRKTHFNRNRWDFAICEIQSDNLIGMTGLIDLSYRHRRAQFYITIGEMSAWGKGYAKEVIPLTLEFAFKELGLEKVYLFTFDNNVKARTIYEKMGFKQEALMKKQYFLHGKLNDLYQHAILKEEFLEMYKDKI